MLILDNAMLQALRDHNDFTYTVDITLAGSNSVDITLTEDDLIAGGCQITRTSGSETFPLGYVYCTQLTLQLFRKNEYEWINWFNAKAVVHGEYEYDEETYSFDLGTYYLIENTTQGETIQIIGYDGVYAADVPATILQGQVPMLAKTVFEECCNYLAINFNAEYVDESGFAAAPSDWDDCEITIDSIPDKTTFRQLMAAVVLLFGANAYISPFNNRMYVVPVKSQSPQTLYWGGYFDSATPYASGDALDGGTFNPWSTGETISDQFGDDEDVINFDDPLTYPEFPLQDITINGVKESSGKFYTDGGDYLLDVDVSLYTTGVQGIINRIGAAVAGLTFRPFTLDYMSFPFVDLFQRAMFADSRSRIYGTIVTHVDIMLKGVTTFKCTAETPTKNNSTYQSVSGRIEAEAQQARAAAAQAQEDAAEALAMVDDAMDEVGLEMVRLNTLMANAMGVFETTETNPTTGAITYYLHNKPTKAASDTIWKMTADGFAVSNDGGTTWVAGIDAQGHAVVNVLSAIGIYADWIQSGRITSDNELSYWDLINGAFSTSQTPQATTWYRIGRVIHDKGRSTFTHLFRDDWYAIPPTEIVIGHIGSSYFLVPNASVQNTYRYMMAVLGKNIVFSTEYSDDSLELDTDDYAFYINSDDTGVTAPYGYTQQLLFLKTAKFKDTVDMAQTTMSQLTCATGYIDLAYIENLHFKTGTNNTLRFAIEHVRYKSGTTILNAATFWKHDSSVVFLFTDSEYGASAENYNDVLGNMIYVMGDVRSTGVMKATAFQNTSDERYKDIEEWDDRYDQLIDRIEPILFKWKNSREKTRHIGVSAQKVKAALDSLGITDSGIVSGSEESSYLVAYNELTTLLIGKVKQQQRQINDLEERLSRIEKILEGHKWQ